MSAGDLRRQLFARGIASPRGNPCWGRSILHKVFSRRVYLGEIHYGSAVNSRAHPALVDEETWRSAQRPVTLRARRGPMPRPLLDGILRCAGCQRPLQCRWIGWGWSDAGVRYTCGRRDWSAPCPSPTVIRDSLVEPYVLGIFWQEISSVGGRSLTRCRDSRTSSIAAARTGPLPRQSLSADNPRPGTVRSRAGGPPGSIGPR